MTRIYRHTIADAPEASRPLLEGYVPFSPTGKLLNLHAQMAHSPLVLAAYAAVRQASVTYGTLDPKVRSALMLVTAAASHSAYAEALTSFLAVRSGWSSAEVRLLRDGHRLGDDKTDSLVAVIREAAARAGRVSDATWQQATDCGWTSEQLTEAFGYLALTVFTTYFVNYAQTPIDLPTEPAGTGVASGAGSSGASAGEAAADAARAGADRADADRADAARAGADRPDAARAGADRADAARAGADRADAARAGAGASERE